MTPLPDPSSLGSIYSMNPAAFAQAQDFIGQGMQGSQIANAQGQEALDQSYRMNPLLVDHQGLQNDTVRETLPGITADSAMRTRKNSMEHLTEPEMLNDIKGKYTAAELKRHVDDTENFGQFMAQQGHMAAYAPFGAAERAKAAFEQAGHGSMWNDEWDTMPVSALSDKLKTMGQDIMDTAPTLRKAFGTANIKADSAREVQEKKSESADKATAARLQAAQALVAQKREAARTPKGMGDWIAKMDQLAQDETDPEVKRQMTAHMLDMVRQLAYVNSAGAGATAATRPDLKALADIDMVGAPGQPPMPSVPGAQGPMAVPSGLPTGTKANGDGTYTLPDGTQIRPKKAK